MKHIIRLFFFICLISMGAVLSQLNLGNGQAVFWVCFGLTLIIGGSACFYFIRVKNHKLLLLIGVALFSVCLFSGSIGYADSVRVSNLGQQDKLNDYKSWVSSFESALKNDNTLKDYDGIMDGTKIPVINGETAQLASRANLACQMLEYSDSNEAGSYEDTCENAKKYTDVVGKVYNSMGSGCSPIASIVKNILNKNSCWPCDVTALVITAIQEVAKSSHEVMTKAALNLMGGLFLLWLAYVTLAFFGKFGFARISEYLTNVLNKAILVLIVAAFLHLPVPEIYSKTVSPFVQFTAGLTQVFSQEGEAAAKKAGKTLHILQNIITGGTNPKCKYCDNMSSSMADDSPSFLDQGSVNGLLCTVCTVYHQVAPMISLGQGLSCFSGMSQKSNSDSSTIGGTSSFGVPRIGALLAGTTIVLIFSFLMFMIAYYIISSVLQLGFVIILLPFWMVAFVFKATREYTKNAWILVLHAMGTLISLSLNVALVMVGFSELLSGKVALALGWGIISGSPTTVMDAFTGGEIFQSQSEGDGSFFSGLTDKLIDFAVNQAIGMSPTHAILLLIAYAILSITIVSNTSFFVERILDAWINREANPQGEMMAGIQAAGKGIGSMSRLGAAGAGAAVGAVSASYARMRDKLDKQRAEASKSSKGHTPNTYGSTAAEIINRNVYGWEDKKTSDKSKEKSTKK